MSDNDLLHLKPDSLDLSSNAVARHDGKIVFVRDALHGETVTARIVRRKPRFDVAQTVSIERESSQRVVPPCPHFGYCGGCSMQHLAPAAQLAVKQRVLEDQLQHLGAVKPETVLRPLAGPTSGYRSRARFSARFVYKKGRALVGFREKGASYVADMSSCHILPKPASDLLVPLCDLLGGLIKKDRIAQIELAMGELDPQARKQQIALVFRHLDPLPPTDLDAIRRFAEQYDVQVWLQPKGPESMNPLTPDNAGLRYYLPEFDLVMPFLPIDFTQVNMPMNRAMIHQALRLLAPQPGESIADLFCGLGNFSLPIARSGASVVGIELSQTLVERAAAGAAHNRLANNTSFLAKNLFKIDDEAWASFGHFDKLLIDPPREGAFEVVNAIASGRADARPARIVYVSCNPATLARDAGVLVNQAGYRLCEAGIVNMFPHTSHVESMARFERV